MSNPTASAAASDYSETRHPPIRNEFHGNGIQNSGHFHAERDIHIGTLPDQRSQILSDLRLTDPRYDKIKIEDMKGGLLFDSYRWILDHSDFLAWRTDSNSRLLWIKGDPGKGKTMLLCGLVDQLRQTSVVPIFFFCQASSDKHNNATAVLRGLIYLLLISQRDLLSHVESPYRSAGKPLFEDENAWEALSDILTCILQDRILQDIVIVIDALDECEHGLDKLVALIMRLSLKTNAKWLLSSRNVVRIENRLRLDETKTRLVLELKTNAEHVANAVDSYIDHRLLGLTAKINDELILHEIKRQMRDKAQGTFLWVGLVAQELEDADFITDMWSILSDIAPGLEKLYARMLSNINKESPKLRRHCMQALSAIFVAYRAMSLEELKHAANLPDQEFPGKDEIDKLVKVCGSFLSSHDNRVSFIHSSARDFVSANIETLRDIPLAHHKMFSRSLNLVFEKLQKNIYGLEDPAIEVSSPDCRPSSSTDPLIGMQYSCVYWMNHAIDAQRDLDTAVIEKLLKSHLLIWVEALSLMQSLPEGIRELSILLGVLQEKNTTRQLAHFTQDSIRFLLYHKECIEKYPLQIYTSALLFTPSSSLVKLTYAPHQPQWISYALTVPRFWDTALHRTQLLPSSFAHSNVSIRSLNLAPSGRQIASCTEDGGIFLHDSHTMEEIRVLRGNKRCAYHFTFSVDEKVACSISLEQSFRPTAKLWDLSSGHCIHQFSKNNLIWAGITPSGVWKVATQDRISRLPYDIGKTICTFWDGATGKPISSLAFTDAEIIERAPDGHHLIIVNRVRQIRSIQLWDMTSESCIRVIELSDEPALPFNLSATFGGGNLATWGWAGNGYVIDIWDVGTASHLKRIKDKVISAVILSPCSREIASCGGEESKIWDLDTGLCVKSFEEQGAIQAMAFSMDGRFASGTKLGSIAFWDVSIREWQGGKSLRDIRSATTDGRTLAFIDDHDQLRIWNLQGDKNQYAIHESCLDAAISPDGKLLASMSLQKDGRISVFDCSENMPPRWVESWPRHDFRFQRWRTLARYTYRWTVSDSGSWMQFNYINLLWIHPDYRGWKTHFQLNAGVVLAAAMETIAVAGKESQRMRNFERLPSLRGQSSDHLRALEKTRHRKDLRLRKQEAKERQDAHFSRSRLGSMDGKASRDRKRLAYLASLRSNNMLLYLQSSGRDDFIL